MEFLISLTLVTLLLTGTVQLTIYSLLVKRNADLNLKITEHASSLFEHFKSFPYELSRIRSQQRASVDSIHRNIAEGYCRRSIKEYIQFLNFALGSLGESVSSLDVYVDAGHVSEADFEKMDAPALRLENGLKKIGTIQKN